jgi:transaldolase
MAQTGQAVKLFIDSANLADIEAALQRGLISGVTTNPSILAKDDSGSIMEIIDLLDKYGLLIPLSVEVTEADPLNMTVQALHLQAEYGRFYKGFTVKIPIGWDELRIVHRLVGEGIKVNVTACMSYNQAIVAANAGATYVSLFWGRIRDTGQDAATVVRQVRETFDLWDCSSQIIVGSIRQMIDVNEAIQAGADIVTVPPQFLPLLCKHPKTDEAVGQFLKDATLCHTT